MLKSIYQNSPLYLQNIFKKLHSEIPYPYAQGPTFLKYYRWLRKTEWFSSEKLEQIQNKQLQVIIKHAYENVPYYKRVFDERNLKPTDIVSKEDLKLLPLLTKEDIRNNFKDLIDKNFLKYSPNLNSTSGSTGEPLKYYIDRNLSILIQATVWRHFQWCTIKPGDRIAVFRGTLINDFGKQTCYYKEGKPEVHFSTFKMSPEVMNKYIRKLNEIKPAMIRGYPASIEILANYICENELSVNPPKAIHTSSEVLLPSQRVIIEKAFNAHVFDWYGHGESTVCAGECERHEGLHLNSEFGCAEFIKTDESKNINNVYNIISTSLWNFSMPLIRYDSEDLAQLDGSKCSCGRNLPLITRIIGRDADIIEGTNGVRVSPSSAVHFWKYKIAPYLEDVKYAQIVQDSKEYLKIKLIAKKCKSNEEIIENQLKKLLGFETYELEYLDESPTGQKWRFTVSNMKK
jgi:phenylacetate-CoA ligase